MWRAVGLRPLIGVGSYLLLNTIIHWLYSVVLPIVFSAKYILIFVRSTVLLANPEAHLIRYDKTHLLKRTPTKISVLGNRFTSRALKR